MNLKNRALKIALIIVVAAATFLSDLRLVQAQRVTPNPRRDAAVNLYNRFDTQLKDLKKITNNEQILPQNLKSLLLNLDQLIAYRDITTPNIIDKYQTLKTEAIDFSYAKGLWAIQKYSNLPINPNFRTLLRIQLDIAAAYAFVDALLPSTQYGSITSIYQYSALKSNELKGRLGRHIFHKALFSIAEFAQINNPSGRQLEDVKAKIEVVRPYNEFQDPNRNNMGLYDSLRLSLTEGLKAKVIATVPVTVRLVTTLVPVTHDPVALKGLIELVKSYNDVKLAGNVGVYDDLVQQATNVLYAQFLQAKNIDDLSSSVFAQQGSGKGVVLDNGRLVVAAPNDDSNAGSVYIFKRPAIANAWRNPVKLFEGDVVAGARYGSAIAADNNLLVVATISLGNNAASVYIYRWTMVGANGSYVKEARINFVQNPATAVTRVNVAVNNGNIVVGLPEAKKVYVLAKSGSSWLTAATLTDTVGSTRRFGESVAIDGTRFIVGAPFAVNNVNAPGTSRAVVYKKSGASWGVEGSFTSLDYLFGSAVAIKDGTIPAANCTTSVCVNARPEIIIAGNNAMNLYKVSTTNFASITPVLLNGLLIQGSTISGPLLMKNGKVLFTVNYPVGTGSSQLVVLYERNAGGEWDWKSNIEPVHDGNLGSAFDCYGQSIVIGGTAKDGAPLTAAHVWTIDPR